MTRVGYIAVALSAAFTAGLCTLLLGMAQKIPTPAPVATVEKVCIMDTKFLAKIEINGDGNYVQLIGSNDQPIPCKEKTE